MNWFTKLVGGKTKSAHKQVEVRTTSVAPTPTTISTDTMTRTALPAWLNPANIRSPQEIAYDFIAKGGINQGEPDFLGFRKVLDTFSEGWEIQNGWATLVVAPEAKTTRWLKNQCAIEGLSHYCQKGRYYMGPYPFRR